MSAATHRSAARDDYFSKTIGSGSWGSGWPTQLNRLSLHLLAWHANCNISKEPTKERLPLQSLSDYAAADS